MFPFPNFCSLCGDVLLNPAELDYHMTVFHTDYPDYWWQYIPLYRTAETLAAVWRVLRQAISAAAFDADAAADAAATRANQRRAFSAQHRRHYLAPHQALASHHQSRRRYMGPNQAFMSQQHNRPHYLGLYRANWFRYRTASTRQQAPHQRHRAP